MIPSLEAKFEIRLTFVNDLLDLEIDAAFAGIVDQVAAGGGARAGIAGCAIEALLPLPASVRAALPLPDMVSLMVIADNSVVTIDAAISVFDANVMFLPSRSNSPAKSPDMLETRADVKRFMENGEKKAAAINQRGFS